ncbi:MAG TPA: carboxylesterase family protein [Bryobacteraceae bacterium]|nr:carboxylesterase family protein [Bryobacteraceae bacterium]
MRSFIAAAWLAAGSCAVALSDPIRTTYGLVSGAGMDFRQYKGIPYAAPPVGDLRWRPPQPPKPWTGVRAATEYGNDCMQSEASRARPQSEDCLFLNVLTPARSPKDKLPVMVWIHGGGFAAGSGVADQYPSEPLPRRGIVLVTMNYRVNVFGFLAHPALTAESRNHSSGNYGLLDQIAALKWVKANIEAFGGDPARVTIFGTSAGGSAVGRLILSPLARGLFHRASAQSPGREFRPLRSLSEAEKLGEFWGKDLAALRAMHAMDLVRRLKRAPAGPTDDPAIFWAIVDGWVIPKEDVSLYRRGKVNAVPLIVGNNEDEIELFFRNHAPITLASYRAYVERWFGDKQDRVLDRYPASNDEEAHESFRRLLGDTEFVYPAGAMAGAMSPWAPVYRYHFTRARGPRKAATHTDQVPYLFGNLHLPHFGIPAGTVEPADVRLSEEMMDAFVRFAATGDPNGGTLPRWDRYKAANDAHLEFGNSIKPGRGLHTEMIDFWESIFGRR